MEINKQVAFNKKLAKIQQDLKAPKDLVNDFAHFNYRSCEAILEAVKPLLGDLTIKLDDDVWGVVDRVYVKATATLSDGETSISAVAFAREAVDKKGMDDAQITGATSSYARKYALNGLFAIDDTKDADSQDNRAKVTITGAKQPIVINKPEDIRDVINGKLPTQPNKLKEPLKRDPKGHTICVGLKDDPCGKAISVEEEKYSIKEFGSPLCRVHQMKERKLRSAKK